ncbi:hypothetical protein [Achromobacter anxifer]|uniref:hypothetical protein n=1 Tax=Achromobacter anxifer TaxID=1287737 RepID=UPI0023F9FBA6|nr:hypothetical protein [Achromobacter anxifer]MDF8359425.1 hypothetical protein [Achromobacter anxifer]
MSRSPDELLKHVAVRCREALIAYRGVRGSLFLTFPHGTCDFASFILGRVLEQCWGIETTYVVGSKHPSLASNQCHVWLEAQGFVLDITHEQFENTGLMGSVFVLDSKWHGQFANHDRRAVEFPGHPAFFPAEELDAALTACCPPPFPT